MKPKTAPGQIIPQKRQPSRWEKEWKRRRFLAILVLVAILAAVGVVGYGFYDTNYKPWHQTIVKVNDKTFDMSYFVKMLHLYGADNNPTQVSQIAQYAILTIQNNELVRQKAKEYNIHVDDITDEEIEAEIHSLFGYDPEGEISEDDFNKQFKEFLDGRNISRSDFEKMAIETIILQEKLQDAMGNEKYPEENNYDHVQVKAALLGTEEEAQEVIENWDGDFNLVIKDYSPSRFYPDSGYWLVMVTETQGEGDEQQLHIQAMLLATEEKAKTLSTQIVEDGADFATLAEENSLDSSAESGGDMGLLSLDDIESIFGDLDTIKGLVLNKVSDPIPENYPDEPIEWLPVGIESSAFDEFAFAEDSETRGVSDPIRDTIYQTKGGYWLVMSYEPEEAEAQEEEGLYIKAILLDSKAEADNLKADIEAGGDFATLAGENSLDTSTTDGDMGWVSLDDIKSKFGEDYVDDIQNLPPDNLSEPLFSEDVSKQSGYWVIEVLKREDRTLSDEHRDSFISDYYSDWFQEELQSGKDEGRIKDYLDEDKLSWALDHL